MHVDRHHFGRRWVPLGMLTLATVLMHAALLGDLSWAWPERETSAHAPLAASMEVRTVAPPPSPLEAPPVTESLARPANQPADQPAPVRASKSLALLTNAAMPIPSARPIEAFDRVGSVAPLPQESAEGEFRTAMQVGVAPKPKVQPAPPAPAASGDTAASGSTVIPRYRTKMPPASTVRYQLSRGSLHGSGELQWRPQGNQYEVKLEGKLGSIRLLTQVSQGGFDADGLAPVRFTDWRIRRSTVAANFQRDAGKVTFSGSSKEMPLQPGIQDRVSWMVQLAAIVAAQPALRTPGAKVVMHLVGAAADPAVWSFKCIGNETIQTGIGAINAIKYERSSPGTYDTTAAAWLDPGHSFLPARATLRNGPGDEGYELQMQDISAP